MTFFPNTRRPYRPLLLISMAMGAAGIALTLIGWALGGSIYTAYRYDDSFDSGVTQASRVEADISTGYVYVRPGEGYSVTAEGVSGDHYTCTVEDGVLKVTYDLRNAPSIFSAARNWQAPTFTVTVPAGGDADISVDVGTIEAAGVDCENLSMTVKTGAVTAELPGSREDYHIRAGVDVGTLRVPNRVYEGFDRVYRSSPVDASRSLTCGVKIGYVRLYFQNDESYESLPEETLAPEYARSREAVSQTVGFHFILPAALPADFSGVTYLVEKSGEGAFAAAQWTVGDGSAVFRMVPHDVDAGDVDDIEESYGEGYYEYELMLGAAQVECIAGADGIYAVRWADPDYEYLIVSDRALSEDEIAAMAESLT
ncbi:MAG TPA: hypothetical protein VN446_08585 [Candidatus Acidoferrum sp.]|nr:hypothetical protein [Candidatus Acidoferrum sp.]